MAAETAATMPYRLVFDVADRFPDIALGTVALVVFAGVGLAALVDFDAILRRWPLVLTAGTTCLALEGVIDRQPLVVGGSFLFCVFSAASELHHRRTPPMERTQRTPLGAAATGFGTFMLVFAIVSGLPMTSAIGLSHQLADGRAAVVEGPVTIDLEVEGGKNECISVADRHLCYSDWIVTPGFNRTRALGGPMRDGLQVRLSTIGNTIVRVEVAEAH